MRTHLTDVAELAVSESRRLGADEAEAFVQRGRTIEVVLERGGIQSERAKTRLGIGIRIIRGKRLGFVHTSILERSAIEKACEKALKLAEISPPNLEWVSLPLPEKIPQSAIGICDDKVTNLTCEDVLGFAAQACDVVKAVNHRVMIDDGKLSASTVEVAVANSHGVSLEEKETILSFFLVCMAKEGDASSSFAYEYDISRTLKDFCPDKVGSIAASKALASQNPRGVESFEGDAILSPDVAADILFGPVISGVNADNVQRGRSVWVNKLGEKVSVPELRLVDDGLLPYGMGSSSFDAEGVPSQRTTIIENGTLRGFLYDSYTANKEGVKSTGNAAKSDYSTLPLISISNLLVEPGRKTIEDLISEVDRGINVNRFSGNVNPQSGDFSGVAKQASYIEGGEAKFPLSETMISGNAFQALHSILKIGGERRATALGVYTPPIAVKNIKVTSNQKA